MTSIDDLGDYAVNFWNGHLPEPVSTELEAWIKHEIRVLLLLWRDVGRLNRNRDMWQELTRELEKIDPSCAWTRHYDRLYFESQLLLMTRTVKAGNRKHTASLEKLLKGFSAHPELLGPLATGIINLPDVSQQAKPNEDIASLDQMMKPLMILRDKAAAHTEIGARLPDLGWNEIETGIVMITEIFKQYSQRLTGNNFQVEFDHPVLKTWHSAFMKPLFSDEFTR
jgi:hypothetical protein